MYNIFSCVTIAPMIYANIKRNPNPNPNPNFNPYPPPPNPPPPHHYMSL